MILFKRLHICWRNDSTAKVLRNWQDIDKKVMKDLSWLDKERIEKYLSGHYHFVRRSKGRKPRHTGKELDQAIEVEAPPHWHTLEDIDRIIEEVKEANSPYPNRLFSSKTPEELDRLVEVVKKANSSEI